MISLLLFYTTQVQHKSKQTYTRFKQPTRSCTRSSSSSCLRFHRFKTVLSNYNKQTNQLFRYPVTRTLCRSHSKFQIVWRISIFIFIFIIFIFLKFVSGGGGNRLGDEGMRALRSVNKKRWPEEPVNNWNGIVWGSFVEGGSNDQGYVVGATTWHVVCFCFLCFFVLFSRFFWLPFVKWNLQF